jgi:hypothetical protein
MKLFKSKFTLPASNNVVHVSQITNAEFVELQKCLFENDDEQTLDFFEYLLQEHCCIDAKNLYNIDKFACLLKLRSISCGDVINFSMTSNNIQMSLSMMGVIDKLHNFKLGEPVLHKLAANMHATIDCSTKLMMSLHEGLHTNMIKSICTSSKETIYVSELNDAQMQMLLSSIDASIMQSINAYINSCSDSICIIAGNETLQIGDLMVSPFNNSMFEFLKFIFKDDLLDAYKMMYILSSKANMDVNFLNAIAPVEQQMYAKFLVEDIEEQNKQLKEASPNLNTHK